MLSAFLAPRYFDYVDIHIILMFNTHQDALVSTIYLYIELLECLFVRFEKLDLVFLILHVLYDIEIFHFLASEDVYF